uniref:Uncharacterized protein n=1 Tax=Caenorhabditis japonica TaxID=281687 RepID=A0A8R1EMD0_CAEJA
MKLSFFLFAFFIALAFARPSQHVLRAENIRAEAHQLSSAVLYKKTGDSHLLTKHIVGEAWHSGRGKLAGPHVLIARQ